MAEIIDFLLGFWLALAAVVLAVGKIYENQQREALRNKRKHCQKNGHQTTHLDDYNASREWCTSSGVHKANLHNSNDQSWFNSNQSSFAGSPKSGSYRTHGAQQTTNAGGDAFSGYMPSSSWDSFYEQRHHHDQQQQFADSGGVYSSRGYEHVASAKHSLEPRLRQESEKHLDETIPTATGFNPDCVEWVNNILYLFFTQPHKYAPVISESIYRSLNEKLSNITHSSNDYSHLVLEFTGINQASSSRPDLTNVRTEMESDKSVSVCCKIYNRRVSLDLSIQQLYGTTGAGVGPSAELQADFFGHSRSVNYELVLENLEGKLKCMAMLGDKLIVIQFMDKPDTKILLKPLDGRVAPAGLISEDALVQIILQALTQVVVDLYFGDDIDFPQFYPGQTQSRSGTLRNKLGNILRIGGAGGGGAQDLKRQIKQELFGGAGSHDQRGVNRRVFVKILKARNINYNQNVACLLELDSPQQQAISSTRPGNSNPNWDEHFLFQLSENTRELSIELWDGLGGAAASGATPTNAQDHLRSSLKRSGSGASKQKRKSELTAGAAFLGLARATVSLDELRRNPVQRLILSLEPAPGATPNDLSSSVGGELAIELLYLENVGYSPSPSPTPSTGSGLKKCTSSNSLGAASGAYTPGDVVSIDRKLTSSGYVITTTTITKQQNPASAKARGGAPASNLLQQSHPGSSEAELCQTRPDSPAALSSDARSEGVAESVATRSTGGPGGRLSRSRSRSLLRAIKKRFSFSRTRSRSLGPNVDAENSDYQVDAAESASELRATGGSATPASAMRLEVAGTADPYFGSRSRASSDTSATGEPNARAKSVPTSRDSNEVPTIVINKSRLSDTASVFTFAHPKSQLVIEIMEPTLERENGGSGKQKGKLRHYAIADNAAHKRKWSKKGLKLHLFNEHQFVACHLAGSSTCHLCGRVFSRRPGKQGYKCRNCHLLSHKQCHAKVDHNCPYAASNSLQLEYIDADPPSSLVEELAGSAGSSSRHARPRAISESGHQHGRPKGPAASRMMAKSISVEVADR